MKSKAIIGLKKFLSDKPKIKNVTKKINSGARLLLMRSRLGDKEYLNWLKKHEPNDRIQESYKVEKDLKNSLPISIVVPVFNPKDEFLVACIESVINQTYTKWELILVDDNSNVSTKKIINSYVTKDKRIKSVINKTNLNIAQSTNRGIEVASGDYIAFLDHDDVLYPNAIYENAKAIEGDGADFIYSDEDKITAKNSRTTPFFKPSWSPDFLRSINYITHLAVIKKELINEVGGLRSDCDGAQDWDLFLRTTKIAKKIVHIEKVLYGWRMSGESTANSLTAKPYVVNAQKKALKDDAEATGSMKYTIRQANNNNDYWSVSYEVEGEPLVTLVILGSEVYESNLLSKYVHDTEYKNLEILHIEGSNSKIASNLLSSAKGDYILFLSSNIKIVNKNWLRELIGDAQRNGVGAVGIMQYLPNKHAIYSAGQTIKSDGMIINILNNISRYNLSIVQGIYANCKRNVLSVDANCMMVKKNRLVNAVGKREFVSVYDIPTELSINGYINIYNPEIEGHQIVASKVIDPHKIQSITSDPYYNVNFSHSKAEFRLV